jgi:hypothetical protein
MIKSAATLIGVCLTAVACPQAQADSTRVYREQTGSLVKVIRVQQEDGAGGSVLHMQASTGESYVIWNDSSRATRGFTYSDPGADTDYSAVRSGDTIRLHGILKGAPVARVLKVDPSPWYESLEFGLEGLAVSGSRKPALAWVVVPDSGEPFLVVTRAEAVDTLTVESVDVPAARVRVSLRGIPAILWSTLYWFRIPDGMFLRFEGPRMGFGSAPTVMMLLSVSAPAGAPLVP